MSNCEEKTVHWLWCWISTSAVTDSLRLCNVFPSMKENYCCGRIKHSTSSYKEPKLSWSFGVLMSFPLPCVSWTPAAGWTPFGKPHGLLSAPRAVCVHFQFKENHLEAHASVAMRWRNDTDNVSTITATQRASYLATAKAKELGKAKMVVARDVLWLRWAALCVSGCVQGNQIGDNAWLFLYHEAKYLASAQKGNYLKVLARPLWYVKW